MDQINHSGHQQHGSDKGVHIGGHHEGHQIVANSIFGRMGQKLDRIITPLSTYLAYAGAAVLGLLVLMLIYSIIARRVFVSPLSGSFEMTELSLAVIIFSVLAYHLLRHEVMTVDIIERYFPKKAKGVLEVIIKFLTVCMLGILFWQLMVQGIRVQGFHQTTRYLRIPIYPFLYLGATGVFVLAMVYLRNFLFSLDRVVKK